MLLGKTLKWRKVSTLSSKTCINFGSLEENVFVRLDGAIKISCRSNNSQAKQLVLWLILKNTEKVVQDKKKNKKRKRFSILLFSGDLKNRNNHMEATQYQNVGLWGVIHAKNLQIKR